MRRCGKSRQGCIWKHKAHKHYKKDSVQEEKLIRCLSCAYVYGLSRNFICAAESAAGTPSALPPDGTALLPILRIPEL